MRERSKVSLRQRGYLGESDNPDSIVYKRIDKAKRNFKRSETMAKRVFQKEKKKAWDFFKSSDDVGNTARDLAVKRASKKMIASMNKAIDRYNAAMDGIRGFAKKHGIEDIVVIPRNKRMM